MMDCLLRCSGAVKRDPAIESWLSGRPVALGALAQRWFSRMRQCGEDVRELMHDGCPVACVADAPFGYVNVFSAHVNVGFYNGATLDDPLGLLEGTGKRMRHVKVGIGRELDPAALSDLIDAAYVDVRRAVERTTVRSGPTGGTAEE